MIKKIALIAVSLTFIGCSDGTTRMVVVPPNEVEQLNDSSWTIIKAPDAANKAKPAEEIEGSSGK